MKKTITKIIPITPRNNLKEFRRIIRETQKEITKKFGIPPLLLGRTNNVIYDWFCKKCRNKVPHHHEIKSICCGQSMVLKRV